MKIRKTSKRLVYGLAVTVSLLSAGIGRAHAQAAGDFLPGRVVIFCQPGTAQADVQTLAAKVNAVSINPNYMADVYELVLPADQSNIAGTTNAIAALKGSANLRWVGPNKIYKYFATSKVPNDTRYGDMKTLLGTVNMEQAWALQTGAAGIEIADIDSGFDQNHEDLKGRYDLKNSYNWGDGNANITAISEDHGVSTSGIMIANTNNKLGVAAMTWSGVLCVGEKVQNEAQQALLLTAILSAYADIDKKYKSANIVAVNMSYGGGGDPSDTTNPEYVALKKLSDDGLILVAAAGNSSGDDHQLLPAAFPFVITVSAINNAKQLTYYSSFGKVDLAAPGGEQFSDTDPNGYLVCKLGSGYAFEQGTSFACPTVCGVAALLMSVPNVTTAKAKQILISTANHTGLTTLPDTKFGYGILDAYNALVQVSASTALVTPDGIDASTGQSTAAGTTAPPPVSTQKPMMSFSAYNIPPANETFTIDPGPGQIAFTGDQLIAGGLANVSEISVVGNAASANPQYTISFRYTFPANQAGTHTIQIKGINPNNGQVITDQRVITVAPHVFATDPSGVTFVSFPYYESAADVTSAQNALRGALLPSSINLYRWFNVPTVNSQGQSVLQGTYAVYGPGHTSADPGTTDANGALNPSLYAPTLDPSTLGTVAPLGTAFFMKNAAPITFNTYGSPMSSSAFRIPLHEGWNMIGDPYNFGVGFNSCEVELLSGARETIQAAVDGKVLLPHVYHYGNGDYSFQTLPDGSLNPWEGQWIYVLPRMGSTLSDGVAAYLIVLPSAIPGTTKATVGLTPAFQRTLANKPAVVGAGSWSIQLQASAGSLHDSNNFVGMSTRATAGMDNTKVPKPPKVGSYVTVGISHNGLSNVNLAQDILPVATSGEWTVNVSTDQSHAPVTLTWPNINTVPRNYRLVLTDPVTGQTIDMRNEGTYQFTSGDAGTTRALTLAVVPAVGRGRAVVSNISINPGRSNGRGAGTTQIGYTVSVDSKVDVAILGLNGKMISQVSPTRAVSSGNNTVVWTGLDANGHSVPAGSYILQIRAVGQQGEVTRQIVPFVVSGR